MLEASLIRIVLSIGHREYRGLAVQQCQKTVQSEPVMITHQSWR